MNTVTAATIYVLLMVGHLVPGIDALAKMGRAMHVQSGSPLVHVEVRK